MTRLLALALILSLAACAKTPDAATTNNVAEAATPAAGTVPLVIRSAKGVHRFDVELALTPEQQEKGLMFRTDLADDGGMIFPMSPPRTASFWMKNTPLPLDILFIHTDGSVAAQFPSVTPYSREPVSAGIPVAAVLELRGGRAAQLGIREGDIISWGACAVPGTAPTPVEFCPAGTR